MIPWSHRTGSHWRVCATLISLFPSPHNTDAFLSFAFQGQTFQLKVLNSHYRYLLHWVGAVWCHRDIGVWNTPCEITVVISEHKPARIEGGKSGPKICLTSSETSLYASLLRHCDTQIDRLIIKAAQGQTALFNLHRMFSGGSHVGITVNNLPTRGKLKCFRDGRINCQESAICTLSSVPDLTNI